MSLIPHNAFNSCENLKTVALSENITVINQHAFSGCLALKDIALPEGLLIINHYAFRFCESLTELAIPDGATFIGNYAFQNSGLQRIVIPASVTQIGLKVFNGCDPVGVAVCGSNAQEYCEKNSIRTEAMHLPGDGCACLSCGAAVHDTDENCLCKSCGISTHDMRELESEAAYPCYECVRSGFADHGLLESMNEFSTGVYVDVNEITHTVADIETYDEFCVSCGTRISHNEKRSNEQIYFHTKADVGCVCGYVCPHANAYTWCGGYGWNDDDLISVTETTHTYRGYAAYHLRCDDCDGWMDEYTVEEDFTEDHYFYEGVCSCGYPDPNPVCTHENIQLHNYSWFEVSEYTDITETTHTAVGTVNGWKSCQDCDYSEDVVLEENASVISPHIDYGHGCVDCGYSSDDEHIHRYPDGSCVCSGCGETEHDESYWMEVHAVCARCGEVYHECQQHRQLCDVSACTLLNSEYHVKEGEGVYWLKCWECGLVKEKVTYGPSKKKETHDLTDRVCVDCGWVGCTHPSKNGCVCDDCGETVHNSSGHHCADCGAHLLTEERCEVRNAVCRGYDDKKHIAIGELWVSTVCRGCGGIIPGSERMAAQKVEFEQEHCFVNIGGAYACADCGWDWSVNSTLCNHSNTVTERRNWNQEMIDCTADCEIWMGSICEDVICADCDMVLSSTVVEEGLTFQTGHVDNGDGYWFNCVHENVEWFAQHVFNGAYVAQDEESHIFMGYVRLYGVCQDCGVDVYDGDLDGEGVKHYREIRQPHEFENCVCVSCGYSIHVPGDDCACDSCGAEVHTPGADCLCSNCGFYEQPEN